MDKGWRWVCDAVVDETEMKEDWGSIAAYS